MSLVVGGRDYLDDRIAEMVFRPFYLSVLKQILPAEKWLRQFRYRRLNRVIVVKLLRLAHGICVCNGTVELQEVCCQC